MSLLAIVVSEDVLQYDAVTEQLARVDELLLVGTLEVSSRFTVTE